MSLQPKQTARPGLNDQRRWDELFARNGNDHAKYAALAADWRYCSVGEKLGFPDPTVVDDLGLMNIIREHAPGLHRLGTEFACGVGEGCYDYAAELHDRIQKGFGAEAETVRKKIDEKYYSYEPDDYDPAVHGCDCDGCLEDDD